MCLAVRCARKGHAREGRIASKRKCHIVAAPRTSIEYPFSASIEAGLASVHGAKRTLMPTGYLPYPYVHPHGTFEAPYSRYRPEVFVDGLGYSYRESELRLRGARQALGRLEHSLVLGAARRILTGFQFFGLGALQAQLELLREGLELKSSEIHTLTHTHTHTHTHTPRGASPETHTHAHARARTRTRVPPRCGALSAPPELPTTCVATCSVATSQAQHAAKATDGRHATAMEHVRRSAQRTET